MSRLGTTAISGFTYLGFGGVVGVCDCSSHCHCCIFRKVWKDENALMVGWEVGRRMKMYLWDAQTWLGIAKDHKINGFDESTIFNMWASLKSERRVDWWWRRRIGFMTTFRDFCNTLSPWNTPITMIKGVNSQRSWHCTGIPPLLGRTRVTVKSIRPPQNLT